MSKRLELLQRVRLSLEPKPVVIKKKKKPTKVSFIESDFAMMKNLEVVQKKKSSLL